MTPLLLIMGLSGQMLLWDKEFCTGLANRRLYVIRFDNRDVGLSTKIETTDSADPGMLLEAAWKGKKITPPYTLDDMADDAFGLLDGLDIKQAHVCGASMGGMIAQTMAIMHPERVLSLISIASTTGNPEIAASEPEAIEPTFIPQDPVPAEREANIDYTVKGMRELSGPGFYFDEAQARILAAESFDRCFYPQGSARQFLAIMASANRKPALSQLTVPTLVIHGDSDPLVPIEGGIDTADAVPGSKLLIIKGMGHDLPRQAWPRIIDAITEHTREINE